MPKKIGKKEALTFLKSEKMGVISSIDQANKHPSSAAVYYFTDDKLNVYLVTNISTRKYKNFGKNNRASFCVFSEKKSKEIQAEGEVELITKTIQRSNVMAKITEIAEKSTGTWPLIGYLPENTLVAIKFTTNWMRYTFFDKKAPNHEKAQYVQII